MDDQIDKLVGSPSDFLSAWLSLSNGGLWELCERVLNGDTKAERGLRKLCELLEGQGEELVERLQWFLKERSLPIDLAERLLTATAQMVSDFLDRNGGDWIFLTEETGREVPQVELQGLGVQRGIGFGVRVKLELHESHDGSYRFLPHPSCCLIPQDIDFQSALESVHKWWVEGSGLANLPAQIVWQIKRSDGRPIEALKGNSLGGLLAVGVWLLVKSVPVDPTISISAAISPDGSLHPVSGLYEKLCAAHQCVPPLRVLIVSDKQDLTKIPQTQSISILPVASIDKAISLFLEQTQQFTTMRERVGEIHRHFEVFSEPVDWTYYQEPTLTVVSEGRSLTLSEWMRLWLRGEDRHWLLVAPSGMGKTTALKFIAHHISANYTNFVPVYLRASDWLRVLVQGEGLSLPEVLESLHRFSSSPSVEHWLKWAELGYLVLLVDQAEAVASNLDFLEQIQITVRDYPQMYLLMASRSEQESYFRRLRLPLIQLEPFTETQAQSLLQKLSHYFNKPLPSVNLTALNEVAPFLLVALLFVDPPIPQGQGQLYLKLLETLFSRGDLPLPSHRVIEILSEIALTHLNKDRWSEKEFYDSLCNLTEPRIADQIWVAVRDRLIVRIDGSFSFAHTLLLESLRAFALARRWQDDISDAPRYLTPLRAILVSSLLHPNVLPKFWELLRRRMESDPKEWAEAVAQCINEQPCYPQQIVNVLLSQWLEAFQRGTNEKDNWDGAIRALPPDVVSNFVFHEARQKLTSKSLSDRRSAIRLLALVAHKVKIPNTLVEPLAEAFMDEYGFTFLTELKTLFAHPLQHELLRHFVSTLVKRFDSESTLRRRRAVEAIDQLLGAGILTDALKTEVTNRLKELVRSELNLKVRSMAQRVLSRLTAQMDATSM